MTTDLIVLNGASSAGTSTIARRLQAVVRRTWLVLGLDALGSALPQGFGETGDGGHFDLNRTGPMGDEFRRVEAAWLCGVRSMASSGVPVILDEVFLDGAVDERIRRRAFDGVGAVWVGVTCDVTVAAEREEQRGDRAIGLAAAQSTRVHEGVTYDVVVDTTDGDRERCVREILNHVRQ